MKPSLNCPSQFLDTDLIKTIHNPETPSFRQFTFVDAEECTYKTTYKTQQSNLLEDEHIQYGKYEFATDKKPTMQSKKSNEMTTSWRKQQLLNSLLLQRTNLISKLDKSQDQKKVLTSKLDQKSKELELVKIQLSKYKQSVLASSSRFSNYQNNYEQTKTSEYTKSIPKSSSIFHSKRSISELPSTCKFESNYSSKQNPIHHEKAFKDRLQRACRRLQVLEEQQQTIRYKNRLLNSNLK